MAVHDLALTGTDDADVMTVTDVTPEQLQWFLEAGPGTSTADSLRGAIMPKSAQLVR